MEIAPKPMGIVERIKQIETEEIARGELIKLSRATIKSSYVADPAYIDSPTRQSLETLDIPQVTARAAIQAINDLGIRQAVTIIRKVPDETQRRFIIPSLGIGGTALSPTYVELFIDPSHPNVGKSLETYASRQVGHELNHIKRMQAGKLGSNHTLLDAIISEGIATFYEDHWQGQDIETPCGHGLNQEELVMEWQHAQLELKSTNFDHDGWFFGIGNTHHTWAVYALGTAIIEAYMKKHPRESMQRLTRRSSEQILRRSDFNPQ